MSYKDDYRKDIKSRKKRDSLYWRPEQGSNTIRILPSYDQIKAFAKSKDWKKALSRKPPFFECLSHREVGPKDSFVRCVGCGIDPDQCEGFICRKIVKLQESSSKAKQAKAEAMKPYRETVFAVAVLDEDTGKFHGPFIWALAEGGAKSLWYAVVDLVVNKKRFYEHPERGYNLTFERDGSGLQTSYTSIEADEEPSKVDKRLLTKIQPWEKWLRELSDEDKADIYAGRELKSRSGSEDFDDDEDEDEDEEPRRKKKSSKKSKADEDDLDEDSDEDDDDDEDDDEDEDDEDDEDAEDEDDSDDEDEEDEED